MIKRIGPVLVAVPAHNQLAAGAEPAPGRFIVRPNGAARGTWKRVSALGAKMLGSIRDDPARFALLPWMPRDRFPVLDTPHRRRGHVMVRLGHEPG